MRARGCVRVRACARACARAACTYFSKISREATRIVQILSVTIMKGGLVIVILAISIITGKGVFFTEIPKHKDTYVTYDNCEWGACDLSLL